MDAGTDIDGALRPRSASEWLIALREAPGDAELERRFAAWRADPAHEADWREIAHTHAVMGRVQPRHAASWAKPARLVLLPDREARILPSRPHRARWRKPAFATAVALAIAACIAVVVFPTAPWWFVADHVTATREVSTLHLADGSTVRLGPESALDVVFTEGARDVRLLRGSAFFEVTPDPKRPFRVATGLVEARVLGTAFEVVLDGEGASVAVRHGTVSVEPRAPAAFPARKLQAGDWLRVSAADTAVRSGKEPPAQVAAWLDGHLIAKDRPAGEVIDVLRRYYPGVVILKGDHLADQPLTGVYDLADPVAAMQAVAAALGAEAYQLSPWVFVLAAEDQPS